MSKYSTEITLILTLLEGWVEDNERTASEVTSAESEEHYKAKAAAYQNVIDWIQSADMPFKQPTTKSVQLCPKCFGEGVVSNNGPSTSSSLTRQCPVCYGTKIFIV